MAQKRMFDKTITNNDKFMELSAKAQCLYFHLSMNADDDGFINNWKSIMKLIDCIQEDLEELINNGYIIKFASGVIVIKHWKINNFLRKDRYVITKYVDELSMLALGNNDEYIFVGDINQLNGNQRLTQIRKENNSIEEKKEDETSVEHRSLGELREGKNLSNDEIENSDLFLPF